MTVLKRLERTRLTPLTFKGNVCLPKTGAHTGFLMGGAQP